MFAGDPPSSGEPPNQFKGYQKIFLQPGESKQVSVTLDPRAFAYWKNTWLIGGGTYKILVGSSSRDIRLQGMVSLGKKTLGP